MTTTDADVSFMTSYFDGEITKQEMLSNFPVEELPKQDETNHDSYKNFVKNLGKLTWVINKYYNSANDDNKIIKLNDILDETSTELNVLKSEIKGFAIILDSASTDIATNTNVMSDSVSVISESSLQMNALLFPIIASIGIIVALQIAIIARNR